MGDVSQSDRAIFYDIETYHIGIISIQGVSHHQLYLSRSEILGNTKKGISMAFMPSGGDRSFIIT